MTALSLVPDLIVNAAADAELTLMLTHLVAARLDASADWGKSSGHRNWATAESCADSPGCTRFPLWMFPPVLLITRLIGGWRRWLSRSGAGGGLRCGRGWWGLPRFVRLPG
ncbi:hypothetical protein AB0F85_19105 [Nocardia fluminea]|uniref:hypothetical protein n=1 Tax=Nocardia fluminea TaxID=134984 RepID=UPI0034103014